MKKTEVGKLAKQYCKKKVKTKKFSDDWQPLSIPEMVEFAEIVVNKFSSNLPVINRRELLIDFLYKARTNNDISWYSDPNEIIDDYLKSINSL